MIGHIDIQVKEEHWEELRELCEEPHLHYEGMNECPICDKPLIEAAIDKIKRLENEVREFRGPGKNLQSG